MAFAPLFTLALGLLGLFDGGFVIWQARGKARGIGVATLLLGLIGILLFLDGTWQVLGLITPGWGTGAVLEDIKTLIAALVGALIPTGLLILALLE
jgi:hypothetical protein